LKNAFDILTVNAESCSSDSAFFFVFFRGKWLPTPQEDESDHVEGIIGR